MKLIEDLRLQNVHWVILGDVALDGREELRFRNTHPLVWQHFVHDYEAFSVKGLDPNYTLFHKGKTASFEKCRQEERIQDRNVAEDLLSEPQTKDLGLTSGYG